MKVFSFVAPADIATFESDLKPFFTYITNTQGFPASQQNLISKSSSLVIFYYFFYNMVW